MPLVALSSTQVNVERSGQGEPLLLIQGLGGTHLSWGDAFLDALGDGLERITYDHRNTGRSGRDDGELSIVQLADDAAELLDGLGLDAAHVVGISMGGMVAQELVLRHPERVRTLTLGCTWPGGPDVKRPDPELWRETLEAQASGDRERALRASFTMNLSPQWTAAGEHYEPFRRMVLALPVAPLVMGRQLQAVLAFDAARAPERDRGADARAARDRGPRRAAGQRRAAGARDRRGAPGAPGRRRAHVLVGAARAQRGARPRPRAGRRA